MSFLGLSIGQLLTNLVDIFLVWFVIYKLIMIAKGTKAVQLLKGIFVILFVKFISDTFNLQTLGWMMQQVLLWGFLAIAIIFQPELRRALEQLGRGSIFSRTRKEEDENAQGELVEALVKSVDYMAKRRIGALISIEKETGLADYIETGIKMNSKISSELLINIFIPNTPLHDGAVIISKNQIAAAACYLPLSDSQFVSKELGTRHRAALGISEVTDSLTIIVSEETGNVTIAKNGELYRKLEADVFRQMLEEEFINRNKAKQTTSSIWNWRSNKNG